MDYYADAEGGQHVADPDHADLVGLVRALDSGEHTTTTAADPSTFATDVLEWVSRR